MHMLLSLPDELCDAPLATFHRTLVGKISHDTRVLMRLFYTDTDLNRDTAQGTIALRLQSGAEYPPISALGQKQTKECPLCPRKQH